MNKCIFVSFVLLCVTPAACSSSSSSMTLVEWGKRWDTFIEDWLGHVPTPLEKMEAAKERLEDLAQDRRCDAKRLEYRLVQTEQQQKVAAKRKDDARLLREAQKQARLETDLRRLEIRGQAIERQLSQVTDMHEQQIVTQASLDVMSAINALTPPSTQQVTQTLMMYQHIRERNKLINEGIQEAFEEDAEDAEEAEMDDATRERAQALYERRRMEARLVEFAQLPKPVGVHVSETVLDESPVDMLMTNRDAVRKIEQFLQKESTVI